MLQDYLQAYLPPSQADAYSQIQGMAQQLDMYLNKYLAQYINCMTSDSEFLAFVNQLALDLTTNPNIWAVLSILLETQDVTAGGDLLVLVWTGVSFHPCLSQIMPWSMVFLQLWDL